MVDRDTVLLQYGLEDLLPRIPRESTAKAEQSTMSASPGVLKRGSQSTFWSYCFKRAYP